MPRFKTALALILSATLSGCGSLGEPEKPPVQALPSHPLELPDAPSLPYLSAAELSCLSSDAYRKLVEREVRYKEYVQALEAVIQSTKDKPQN